LTANRRLLGLTFFLGCVGTGTELLLIGHVEDAWQYVPIVLLGIGAIAYALVAAGRDVLRKPFGTLMIAFAISGAAGSLLHYNGNAEFEREIDPEVSGVALFSASMRGATPALAPGTMMLLGAVGWAYIRVSGQE
jgi:hypothetical protein